jgi:hypothetical protein
MSIFLTTQVSYATKVEAFNLRGLQNQVSVRACDSGVYAISRSPEESRIRFAHMHDELPARLKKTIAPYARIPKFVNILPRFDGMHFEVPTLITEMKSGGEVLHAFGMFETGTSKIGMYAGKPSSDQIRQIMTLGLDVYDSVPAGNVNLAGYCAFIQAWRGINAFFYIGGGDASQSERMKGGVSKALVEELSALFVGNTNAGIYPILDGGDPFSIDLPLIPRCLYELWCYGLDDRQSGTFRAWKSANNFQPS